MQCRAHLPVLTQEVHDDDINRSTGSHYLRSAAKWLIVVDMQNAYATPGGYLDLAGLMSQPLARSLPTFKPP